MTAIPVTPPAGASFPQTPAPISNAELCEWIVHWVAAKLKVPTGEVDPDVPLIELGLDSLEALELSGRLETLLLCEVSPLIVREHPTISAISAFLTVASSSSTPG